MRFLSSMLPTVSGERSVDDTASPSGRGGTSLPRRAHPAWAGHETLLPTLVRRGRWRPGTDVHSCGRRDIGVYLSFVTTNEVWAALADPSRRRIVERLAESPRTVAELTRELPLSQPAISQHLKVLRAADIVAYTAGRMKKSRIKTLAGDRVTIEMSPYDLEKGRVIFRHKDERAAPVGRAPVRNQFRRR